MGQLELDSYENSLKTYRDLKCVIDTAFDEGKLEGKIKGLLKEKLEIAKSLKINGISPETISKTTGLSKNEIKKL
jgi:predicted transposase/invertase (TIGR01784 family)